MTVPRSVDLAMLQAEMARQRPPRGIRLLAWAGVRALSVAAASYFAAFVVPDLIDGAPARAFSISASNAWIKLGLPVVLALATVLWSLRAARRSLPEQVRAKATQIERGWAQLTGPRWVLRMSLWGLTGTVAITVVVGPLVTLASPPVELVAGSRALTILAFFGFTLAWAVPMMFAIRWLWLRLTRRFVVAA